MRPYIGVNCEYCGKWDCKADAPICDEQREGKPSNHPCRQFKAGDFIHHEVYGMGQICFVLPIHKGLRITFNNNQPTEWYSHDGVVKVNDVVHPALDSAGKSINVGSKLMYPLSKGGAGNGACIRTGTVKKIGDVTHRGYGYYTRKLSILDEQSGRIVSHNYPANCMITS